MTSYLAVLLFAVGVLFAASAGAQDATVEGPGDASSGLAAPRAHGSPVELPSPAPPSAPDPRVERVLAMLAMETLCIGATIGAGLAIGYGGGRNGLEGGVASGGALGAWLVAPIAVHLTGGLVSGHGSLGGAVVGMLAGAGAATVLSSVIWLASTHLDDVTLGVLGVIDTLLVLAGPVVGYEVSHDDARRTREEPRFAPSFALGPQGVMAGLRVAL